MIAEWAAAGELPSGRRFWGDTEGAVRFTNGQVLVTGGLDAGQGAIAETVLYDPGTNTWSVVSPMQTSRAGHTVTLTYNNEVLVIGGYTGRSPHITAGVDTVEVYSPYQRTWSSRPTMSVARWSHTATSLGGDRVLVVGGGTLRGPGSAGTLGSAEIYDSYRRTWTTTGAMTEPRQNHSAVRLLDGRVLVVGGLTAVGYGQYASLAFCELYNPATGTWTPTGSLDTPRSNHQTTLLQDGSVLVTGGWSVPELVDGVYDPSSLNTAELYDPTTGHWTRVENMPAGRCLHRAIPLRSGEVLLLGGTDSACVDAGHRSATVYDPIARTWTDIAPMATGRWAFAATSLADGRVLVVGGAGVSGVAAPRPGVDVLIASAEVLTLQGSR